MSSMHVLKKLHNLYIFFRADLIQKIKYRVKSECHHLQRKLNLHNFYYVDDLYFKNCIRIFKEDFIPA